MIWTLLILFQVKHFIADYPLQTKYMLGKFKPGWDFFGPLFIHSYVHAGITFNIVMFITLDWMLALQLAALDLVVHFIVDRIKAGPKYLGRFKSMTKHDFETHEWLLSTFKKAKDSGEITQSSYEEAVAIQNSLHDKDTRSNKLFWWSLGADQMAHHLTHYVIIYMIMKAL